jgi:addiction module RelE/StbE family toxin
MKIIWSPLAVERMEEISDYIAYDKPLAANKWINNIFNKVELLKNNPKMGRIVPELNIDTIRELIFGNYRLIYRFDMKSIIILTIRNFKQLLTFEDI